jgi:hypothetical protein
MRCDAQMVNAPYAWQNGREQCTCMVPIHLKSTYEHDGMIKKLVASTNFKLWIFPPKSTCMHQWSCDIISCNAMMDLETIGQKKQFAKRVA